MPFTLEAALANYRQERPRLKGQHPSTGCSCAFCDVVRAADLLHETALAEARRWKSIHRRRSS